VVPVTRPDIQPVLLPVWTIAPGEIRDASSP
jgi:hypothetical protein